MYINLIRYLLTMQVRVSYRCGNDFISAQVTHRPTDRHWHDLHVAKATNARWIKSDLGLYKGGWAGI